MNWWNEVNKKQIWTHGFPVYIEQSMFVTTQIEHLNVTFIFDLYLTVWFRPTERIGHLKK